MVAQHRMPGYLQAGEGRARLGCSATRRMARHFHQAPSSKWYYRAADGMRGLAPLAAAQERYKGAALRTARPGAM